MRRPGGPAPWQPVAGVAICLLLGWFAFVRGVNVPGLWLVDLGFHELGHLLTYVFPDVVTAMMGSITQVAVPWGLAAYFFVRRGDVFGGVVCMAWTATSLHNASVYIADAPYQRLQLIGGNHDWAFVLWRFGALERAEAVATAVEAAGLIVLLNALVICAVAAAVRPSTRSRHLTAGSSEPVVR